MPTSFTTVNPGDTITSAQQNSVYSALNNLEKGVTQFVLSTGAANAFAIAPSPAYTALVTGNTIHMKASFTNTGAATLNTSALGALAIQRPGGITLDAGNIQINNHYILRYDGAVWQLLNPHIARFTQEVAPVTTAVGNVGAGEDDLLNFTLPAASLNQLGQRLDFRFVFTFAANANSKQVKVKFGTATLYDSTAQTQSGGSMIVEGTVFRTGAATQDYHVRASQSAGATFTNMVSVGVATETLSSAIVVKATGEGVANDDIVNEHMFNSWG